MTLQVHNHTKFFSQKYLMGATCTIFSNLISRGKDKLLSPNFGWPGSTSRLLSGLKSQRSSSRFTSEEMISRYENARWPAKVEVKGLRYSSWIGPGQYHGVPPRPPHRLVERTPAPLFALRSPWTPAESRGWGRGPRGPGGPAPRPGKLAARAARPGSRGQRR